MIIDEHYDADEILRDTINDNAEEIFEDEDDNENVKELGFGSTFDHNYSFKEFDLENENTEW